MELSPLPAPQVHVTVEYYHCHILTQGGASFVFLLFMSRDLSPEKSNSHNK